MTIRAYLWGMRFCTLVALAALALVVYRINPEKDGIPGQTLFYISLFFFITGIATLFLFGCAGLSLKTRWSMPMSGSVFAKACLSR